ncbi:MAG TPA: hypothetical protein VHV75_09940 [Solirubrobacteraceae bacterium]|jgi:hypothetical protein|nr:hypothetical protein [Solirubrobacteraceae bacterium]
MSRTQGYWLQGLSPEQRVRVDEILGPRRNRNNTSGGGRLSIKYSPTTCPPPRDVVLLLRAMDGTVIREWRIWPPEDET